MPTFLTAAIWWTTGGAAPDVLAQPAPPPCAELLEDGADELLKMLTNPGDGQGQGQQETNDVFSGKSSLKITQYQRFHRTLPNWNYAIRATPKAGEYRYLRFAWKSAGANCLMLQLHDVLDWNIRYTAGANPYGWGTRFVADAAPAAWALQTIDLFKDFGERNLTGIAFTIHGGAGLFDHVYLGRTIEDLDRIDATGLAGKKLMLQAAELNRRWMELSDKDAAKQYRAYWTLVAGGAGSAAFLREKTTAPKVAGVQAEQIRDRIAKLDSTNFAAREKAMAELRKQLESAGPWLEAKLANMPSAEMRRRIETLLAELPSQDAARRQRAQAARILNAIQRRASAKASSANSDTKPKR